jgi:DNA-binding GntR family transcriptional regulator
MPAMTDGQDDLTILRTRSLSGVLERQIEAAIFGGEVPRGKRVNEYNLAKRFGTSRGPVREALRTLEGLGIVELIPNRGVFVCQPDLATVLDIYDVRAALFGLAGKLLAERVTNAQLADLRQLLDRMDEAVQALSLDDYYPMNLAFHALIIESCGNATLATQYKGLVKKLHLFRTQSLVQGGGLEISNSEHREMYMALAKRDPLLAQQTHAQHVERAKQRLLAASQKTPNDHPDSRSKAAR